MKETGDQENRATKKGFLPNALAYYSLVDLKSVWQRLRQN